MAAAHAALSHTSTVGVRMMSREGRAKIPRKADIGTPWVATAMPSAGKQWFRLKL